MSRSTRESSVLELTSSLAPSAISQFLASNAWELESRQNEVREIWRLPAGDDFAARIMLPLDSEFADYSSRLYDALYAIGRVNDWDADQLYEHIIAAKADLLYIRLDQSLPDGTIPFRQAETTINAIYRMMRAAATTASDPRHSHRGRRSATVTEFLDDDVRLGHTKRGSFIFTVVTRMDGNIAAPPPQQASLDEVTPFSRRVMETLARGLETTQRLTRGEEREALDNPSEWGLSANLVESLEDMAQPEGLRSLDLSFEWAAARDRPDVGTAPIKLEHEVFGELARVRERLIRHEEPPRRETLVGPVKSLTREEGSTPADEIGTVVILADVNGKTRNVQVTLSGENHEWAIKAYQSKLPFTVTGDLGYERRAWRLTGDIEVDASFLQHRLGDLPRE